ncbi:MAG: mandelate racemase/muconate lactonizing enzyme family protein [Planctomycetes bacterium]|nr:mandelate racemase/muconate lactonizing enzyme family protein [Planctomycetota bacterium]
MSRDTDITVKEVRLGFRRFDYRTPMKFRGVVGSKSMTCDAAVLAETPAGKTAWGFGSMIVGSTWSFPSKKLDSTGDVLRALSARATKIVTSACGSEYRHPLDHSHVLEPLFLRDAVEYATEVNLGEAVPPLATLVATSPLDAAIHDAFGKVNGLNVYNAYGPDFASNDLATYLDDRFKGEYLDMYTLREPKRTMPLYHLVGGIDALTQADLKERIDDALPETLGEWMKADGLTHLKIKMDGQDAAWDIQRIIAVNEVADSVDPGRDWQFSIDFNERCENVDYLLDVLAKVKESSAEAFDRIQYIEQPTSRDLDANPQNKMHEAAKIKPVVIDEALTGYESLLTSIEMGYSGVALKACKGQSQSLILGAAAQKLGLFLCVQDLTCTGPSYLHSVGLAARIPTVAAVEGNGRQYCPAANEEFARIFPTTFKVTGGTIETGVLTGPGLGCVPDGYVGEGLEVL